MFSTGYVGKWVKIWCFGISTQTTQNGDSDQRPKVLRHKPNMRCILKLQCVALEIACCFK